MALTAFAVFGLAAAARADDATQKAAMIQKDYWRLINKDPGR
jgi:hypothetical protein